MARRKGEPREAAPEVVVPITRAANRGGRPSGLGYDPETGESHSTGEHDLFTFTGGEKGYRPDRFYTKSTDQRGHGEKIQVRVPQGIDSQVHAAVRDIPEYRSLQDFVRDALVHRLEWVQKQYQLGEEAERILALERFEADNKAYRDDMERMDQASTELEESLVIAVERKDWSTFTQVLGQGDELMEWLRDPYRTKCAEVLQTYRLRHRDDVRRWSQEIMG